jgi:hypothetical protein
VGFNVGVFQTGSSAEFHRQSQKELVRNNDGYNIYMMSPPVMQPLPFRAEIKESFRNVVKGEILATDLSLNDDREKETIRVKIGPLPPEMVKMLEVDKEYTFNNLVYKRLIKTPSLKIEPAGNDFYTASIDVAINENIKIDSTSSFYKGDRFYFPFRLYYKTIPTGTNDTLVLFQSNEDVTVRFTNYPILSDPINYFEFVDSTATDYNYEGSIAVQPGLGRILIKSEKILNKIYAVPQEMSNANIDDMLYTNLTRATGEPTDNEHYRVKLKIPKERLSKTTKDVLLVYQLKIMTSGKTTESMRIGKILIPLPPRPATAAIQ